MCHPQGGEKRFRIAAKAMLQKTVAKVGFVLETKLESTRATNRSVQEGTPPLSDDQTRELEAVREVAQKWREKVR